jgi:serine/threonine-protein kinase
MSGQEPSSIEPVAVDPRIAADIEAYAAEALARFGASGALRVHGNELVLTGPGGARRTELGPLQELWPSLPEEARRRRTMELVRRLVGQRAPVSLRPERRGVPSWAFAVLALAAAAGGLVFALRSSPTESDVVRRRAAATAPGESQETVEDRHARAARVCEATRTNVLRGATIGPTDLEGWVVDAVVLKRGGSEPLEQHPALSLYLKTPTAPEGSPFVWKEEPELAQLDGSDTRVTVKRELIEGSSAERTPGVRLTFEGRLTEHYFNPEKRRAYFHVISSLTDALGGTHAGLFARCAGGATHHVGVWFRGPTPGEAAASLVYLLGTYAEPPHLVDAFLHGPTATELDRSIAFGNIRAAGSKLTQRDIASVVGRSGGMISGPANGPFVITFPFTDGNRGSRASRDLARATSIGRE